MTPSKIPRSLRRVLLSIRVSGRVFRRAFEADPDLEFVYGWDRRNAYDQKVFGVAEARVAVGYQYKSSADCPSGGGEPIWTVNMIKMKAFDVDISNVGEGWNLEIHHHYNAEQGMTEKMGTHFFSFSSLICGCGVSVSRLRNDTFACLSRKQKSPSLSFYAVSVCDAPFLF